MGVSSSTINISDSLNPFSVLPQIEDSQNLICKNWLIKLATLDVKHKQLVLDKVLKGSFSKFEFFIPQQIGHLPKGLNPPSANMLYFSGPDLELAIKTGIVTGILSLTVSWMKVKTMGFLPSLK